MKHYGTSITGFCWALYNLYTNDLGDIGGGSEKKQKVAKCLQNDFTCMLLMSSPICYHHCNYVNLFKVFRDLFLYYLWWLSRIQISNTLVGYCWRVVKPFIAVLVLYSSGAVVLWGAPYIGWARMCMGLAMAGACAKRRPCYWSQTSLLLTKKQ